MTAQESSMTEHKRAGWVEWDNGQHCTALDDGVVPPLGLSRASHELLPPGLEMELEDPRGAKRSALDAEIHALRDELACRQDDLNANRSNLARGKLARAQSEIMILQTKVEELQQERKKLFAMKAQVSRSEEVACRIEGYYEEIQEKLGISATCLDREVAELLRFHENGDGSFEAIAVFKCNTQPGAKKRDYVDFRFIVPSAHSPLTITVGPLSHQGFILLSRKPQATETCHDQRTYPALEQQRNVSDAVRRTSGSEHTMVLKNGGNKIEVGVYYLTVCTGGDRLEECAVRLYIPTRRSPALHYNWYGLGRRSGNKVAEEAANLSWRDAKATLKIQDNSRKLVGGGSRRFGGEKPLGQERYTPTLDLRRRPVRLLYSRVEENQNHKIPQRQARTRPCRAQTLEPEDVWTRLSRPLAFSARMQNSGRHEALTTKSLQVKNVATSKMQSRSESFGQSRSMSSQLPASIRRGSPDSTHWVSTHPSVVKARPASARPASAQGSHQLGSLRSSSGYDKLERQRPFSAMGRVRGSVVTPARAAPNKERPRSAMARIGSKLESSNDGVSRATDAGTGHDEHALSSTENPFASIVSQDARQIIKSAAGMSAEQQLRILQEDKANSVANILKSTSIQSKYENELKNTAEAGRAKKFGLAGLVKAHKEEVHAIFCSERHGAKYLEETLNEYEERDTERYKLPFAHVFMEVISGRNIPRSPDNYCSPYVTVTLKDSESGQIDEKKTSIQHSKQNPEWKTSLQFKCYNLERDAVFSFACWHHSSFAHVKDVPLGHALLALRDLKVGVLQEWNLPVQPLVRSKDAARLKVTTFYGKHDEFLEWKKKPAECKAKDSIPDDGREGKGPAGVTPSDLLDELFKKWSRAGKERTSVDFKEFTDMLKDLELMPMKIGKHKAQEIFRQANRRAGKSACDGNIDELDRHEFDFAIGKVGEFCKVDVEMLLIGDNTDNQATHPKIEEDACVVDSPHDQDDCRVITDGELHRIWASCSPWTWESLGVGADLFAFLGALHKQEEGRLCCQTIDFLQEPPFTGTARVFAPDAETIDLERVDAPDHLLLYMTKFDGPHIKTLRIGGCNQLSLSAVLTFANKFRFISSLSLRGQARVDDQWLKQLSQALHLQDLIISDCIRVTDEGLASAASASRGLRRLDCCNCMQVSDGGVMALGDACPQLESLSIRGCLRVSDVAILSVLVGCPHLSHLNVAGLKSVCLSLANNGHPKLQSLNVSNCGGFDDVALEQIARFGKLQSLTAYANTKITDVGLQAVASCTNLTALSLARCPQVSDSGVIKIATACRRLRHINVDFCPRVSDTSLTFIADYNGELQHLSLRGCAKISALGVKCVLKHCPWLNSLDVAHSGANEAEVRDALTALHEAQTQAQREEDLQWLVGKKGTPTWTGIEVDDTWLSSPRAVDCTFSNAGAVSACESTRFTARRDLPPHLAIPHMMAKSESR